MAQFYPDEVIQEVRANNDIVDIVSEYVQLKRVGNRFMGLCPFHKEKTPSFSVSPDKQLYNCFGCGAAGTVIHFIMEVEHLDFIEGLKLLADRARIVLPEGNMDGEQAKKIEQKQLILEINKEAARYFFKCLNSPEGQEARIYLKNRMINKDTVKSFGLGYALKSWDALINYLTTKGYSINDLLQAGLIIENKDKKTYYDRFRNRIIFPIIDLRGNVIGFGGRVLDHSLPKYLNSPETIVFNKSRNLYGLNYAKNSGKKELIIVEGYMDVISLHQNGIINSIASLGTALTHDQARLIKKFCQEVIIAYDSDAAGQTATLRGLDILADTQCRVKVLTIKEGKDPDEYIKLKGVERFKKSIQESKSLVEYKIDLLKNEYDIDDIEQKIKFVNEMAKIFVGIQNAIERDAYVQKIAQETGIASQAIFAEIQKIAGRKAYIERTNLMKVRDETYKNTKTTAVKKSIKNSKLVNAEKMLLNVLCYDKNTFNRIREIISPTHFTDELHQKVGAMIYSARNNHDEIDPTQIVTGFEGEEMQIVASILHMETNFEDNYQAAIELVNSINKEKNKQQIKSSLQEGNVEKLHTLLEEYKKNIL
ncbi:DNA primase [Petroclostridium sp. X23]|uniref:DNA primase n=1 Tax=Petroclostridium sp. X23 TaxID=3045146 RepID=UPI0024AD8B85|nr:DNA primase [Petroclostridium sp. X23]WHH59569.1 DNA primase [Petroclostridium sp. X23]